MSTQINITVDSGGLSDRAKQQQQAARQAQLEKERTLNLSAEALDKRVAAQAAKGQSLDGQPLYTAGFNQPQLERRPAATRQGGVPHIFLEPSQGYGTYGIRAKNKYAQSPIDFVRDTIYDTFGEAEYGQLYRPPYYQDVNLSPTLANGRAALIAKTPPGWSDGQTSAVYDYVGTYILTDKLNISAVSQYTTPSLSTNVNTPPPKRVQQNGASFSDLSGKYLLKDYNKFTFECWLRTGEKTIPDSIGFFIRSASSAWFGSCSFALAYGHSQVTAIGGGYRLTVEIPGTSIFYTLGAFNNTSVISQTSWQHCAITRDESVLTVYVNGNAVATQTLPSSYFPGSGNQSIDSSYPYGGFYMTNGSLLGEPPGFVAPLPAIHGYRVTPKVLYTSSFVPQFPLTGFA